MRRTLLSSDNPGAIRYLERIQALDSSLHLIEERIERLFAMRHEHPIWPSHDRQLDALEKEMYEPIREVYYGNISFLIELARQFKR